MKQLFAIGIELGAHCFSYALMKSASMGGSSPTTRKLLTK